MRDDKFNELKNFWLFCQKKKKNIQNLTLEKFFMPKTT